ncbi:Alpha/Beta hydrolase protein [Rhypophila decipiens]|uniref:Alpha/Beta hydrolase protein n=1 Tax=Rhypophila decipiens TaxID=261697 RepID=A0AAN6XVW5_9PEZI|nr:Alpha/Beta hydrolase protein [Rhypophila decipiens]
MPLPPWSQRLKNAATVFLLQKCLIWPVETIQSIRVDVLGFGPAETKPDLIKTFPGRKGLPVRIFIPSSVKSQAAGSQPEEVKVPLTFTIHGGGFVIGSPADNDAWNRRFSDKHSHLVIALNYRKGPDSPFPNPVDDLEALALAGLSAPASELGLPSHVKVDLSRISVIGWSAGGNLSLALSHRLSTSPSTSAKLSELGATISSVVPIYPVVDFTIPTEAKLKLRQYKPLLGGFRGKPTDFLAGMAPIFDWAYIPANENLTKPELSPYFAEKDTLPKNLFMVACELDMLGHEAWRFANKFAGRTIPGLEERIGREEIGDWGKAVVEGDERFGWEVTDDGENRRVKWLLVPDTVHGFDQDLTVMVGGDKEVLEDAKLKTEELIGVIGGWLEEGWRK